MEYISTSLQSLVELTHALIVQFPYTAVDCGVFPNSTNGAVDTSSGTTFMMTATYTCNDGYMRIGSENIMCGSNRNWTPEALICERKLVI